MRVVTVLLSALILFSACESPAYGNKRTTIPNIVFIIADDMDWREFGYMGHPHLQTPNLDRLASEGAVYTNGINSDSVCKTSLRTLLTGMHPNQWNDRLTEHAALGITYEPGQEVHAFDTLPTLLAQRGYVSYQAGKYWEGTYADGGFTDGMTDRYLPDSLIPGFVGNDGLTLIRAGHINPVLDFIDEHTEEPFFVWFAPMVPHIMHTPPLFLLLKYRVMGLTDSVSRYYGMIDWLDHVVGNLRSYIDGKGLGDNTLYVFLSDNGWIQPVNNPAWPYRQGWGEAGGKNSSAEAGHRTQVILHWPKHIRPSTSDRLVSTADVWATMLDYAHVNTPKGVDGCSLRRHKKRKSIALAKHHEKWDVNNAERPWDIYTTEKWWVIWPDNGAARIYDRLSDPDQLDDLAPANPGLVDKLRLDFESVVDSGGC